VILFFKKNQKIKTKKRYSSGTEMLYIHTLESFNTFLTYLPVSSTATIKSRYGKNQRNGVFLIFLQKITLHMSANISK
jgi:hypothetical protein